MTRRETGDRVEATDPDAGGTTLDEDYARSSDAAD